MYSRKAEFVFKVGTSTIRVHYHCEPGVPADSSAVDSTILAMLHDRAIGMGDTH